MSAGARARPLASHRVSARAEAEPAVLVEGVAKRFRMPRGAGAHAQGARAAPAPARAASSDSTRCATSRSTSQQGEFFGIVGRNGSGKSTLLKCLAGIYRVDGGAIACAGRLSTFIELGVGFNPDLAAARQHRPQRRSCSGSRRARRAARVDDVIAFAELEEFVDLKLKNYSSGMQVRLAFSVMIQVDADVLLIDEVLAVGDAAFQQKCFDVFHRMRDEGRTILFVTHDMGAVRALLRPRDAARARRGAADRRARRASATSTSS